MTVRPATNGGHLNRFMVQDATKLRGGYYTSQTLAEWLCQWAIRRDTDQVLEPSCGNGVFLSAALKRFNELGVHPLSTAATNLSAVEVVPEEAEAARHNLYNQIGTVVDGIIKTGDFFEYWLQSRDSRFDVVIGNPPFIRYQTFPEEYRLRAMNIMTALGLKPNRLTNIWVPFVVAATASLRPGGRLALVLPAELLQVTYAAQLRSFLTDRFSHIDIITCNELFFANAEQEVVLLLADGALAAPSTENECQVRMTQASSVGEISTRDPASVLAGTEPKVVRHDSEKWLKYFLSNSEIALMRELRESELTCDLVNHAEIDVGVVTGRNAFFVLDSHQIRNLNLTEYTVPLVSRSNQLRGTRLDSCDWQELAAAGHRVHLLHLAPFNGDPLTESVIKYIKVGEQEGVNLGYKCSIRSPWYAVPSVWQPQGFLFRQIYDFPRSVVNTANATSTDTIHRIRCIAPPEEVVANTYTYLTAASAEIEGRSYGGGVLELEPTEAERLLMPADLKYAMPIADCDNCVRSGSLDALLVENSEKILVDGLGLTADDCGRLREIWIKLRDRRNNRRRQRATAATNSK